MFIRIGALMALSIGLVGISFASEGIVSIADVQLRIGMSASAAREAAASSLRVVDYPSIDGYALYSKNAEPSSAPAIAHIFFGEGRVTTIIKVLAVEEGSRAWSIGSAIATGIASAQVKGRPHDQPSVRVRDVGSTQVRIAEIPLSGRSLCIRSSKGSMPSWEKVDVVEIYGRIDDVVMPWSSY